MNRSSWDTACRNLTRHARASVVSTVMRWFAVLAFMTIAGDAESQSARRLGTTIMVAPAFQAWRFGDAVRLDSLQVRGASQVSVPFSLQLPVNASWTVSATGAVSTSRLDASLGSGSVTRTLTGFSDLRLRTTGRMRGEALQLTFGLNVPTGTVGLSSEQYDVLRVIAAPAIDAQMPLAGIGLGGTVGAVAARTVGTWAWALGAGYEKRGSYSPVDLQLAGLSARTELKPGGAVHLSVGADGLVGVHRLSLGIVGDFYGADRVERLSSSRPAQTEEVQLQPTVSAVVALEVSNPLVRDLTVRLNNRYRSGFRNAQGNEVTGSSGNYLEVAATGLVGSPGQRSLLLGLDARQHTGLAADESFIGAGLTAIGLTLGGSLPSASFEWRPSVRLSAGSLRTARVATSISGLTLGLTVNAR